MRVRDTATFVVPSNPPIYRRAAAVRYTVRASKVWGRRIDPRVMEKALELAGDDPSRLLIGEDGSVLVTNNGR